MIVRPRRRRGLEIDVVEAGRAQGDQAQADPRQTVDHVHAEVVVDEGADGVGPLGKPRRLRRQPRLEEAQLVAVIGAAEEELVMWLGAEDGDAHRLFLLADEDLADPRAEGQHDPDWAIAATRARRKPCCVHADIRLATYFRSSPGALAEVRFDVDLLRSYVGQAETMFALSNGYLGLRGTMDESTPVEEPGTYLNGFYETRPITYGESAYGFPKVGQSMLSCPDGSVIRLTVDDEPLDLARAEVLAFSRRLDLGRGVLERDVTWLTARGRRLRLRTTRLVSWAMKHVAAIRWGARAGG